MKIQQAIRILANTKIKFYEDLPSSSKDRNLLDKMMCCASNFEPLAINKAFQEIIKWWMDTEVDIMGGEIPSLPDNPTQKEMIIIAIRDIRAKRKGKYKLSYNKEKRTIEAIVRTKINPKDRRKDG